MRTMRTDSGGGALRVLWLTQNYHPSPGGMAQSCDRIVRGLREAGVEIDLVHLVRGSGGPMVVRRRSGRDLRCPMQPDGAHALNALWSVLAGGGEAAPYSHVVAFGGVYPLLAGPVYAAWLGCPLVTLIRGNDFDAAVFDLKRRALLVDALERSVRVCAVSQDKVDKIRALAPGITVEWTPSGIDLGEWAPLPSDRERAGAAREVLAAGGRRVLGLFGEIKRKKGALLFLEALVASGHAGRFHLLLVGEAEAPVLDWLDQRGREIAFSVFPFTERFGLLRHYLSCDMVVLPSLYDGLPNVLLEAGALEVPFIAAATGGMADFLEDGAHGFLFAPGDPHGCREAIHRAAHAPDAALRARGSACRRLVEDRLTATHERDRYLEVLHGSRAASSAPGSADRRSLAGLARGRRG